MFEADRPIQKCEQDRLGRTIFAKYLARCILDHTNPESLVLGLYGSWGTGKTSILNLVLEELNFAASNMFDDEKPIILNFSPWSYSGQQSLVYNFFRRLSSTLRQATYLENAEKIIEALELYASFFTQKPVPKSLHLKNFLKNKLLTKKSPSKTYGWGSGRDLTIVKAELNALLRQQKHKIIIIIDNISNIETVEIKQIFQIVKSMADYSNTVYFLSMDKKIVINALNQIYGGDGKAFLEKVIQLPFDVPSISNQDLDNILLDKLKNMLGKTPSDRWDTKAWADVYYSSLRYFFKNCRDITRYINTVSFGLHRLKDVVNLVDFIAITAIEIFEPRVYIGIRDNKDLFTDLMNHVYPNAPTKLAEDKLRCDEILSRAAYVPPEHLLQLILYLFPHLRAIYQPTIYFYHSESLSRKGYRISSPDLFDAYFRLSINNAFIPTSECDAILALSVKAEAFDQVLTRLNQDGRISNFLDLLDGIDANKIPIDYVPNIIIGLMDNADLFPEGENTLLTFNTPIRIHRIFNQLLHRYDNLDTRFEIFERAIRDATKSLYIIIHELSVQSTQHAENTDTFIPSEYRDFTLNQLEKLKNLAVEKIKFWEHIQRLAEHPKLIPILYAWKNWGNEHECSLFVAHITQDDRGLLSFLQAALKEPIQQAMAKLKVDVNWETSLVNIENFISITAIEPHAKTMFEDASFETLREQEQLALLIFLDLIKAKTKKIIPKTTV
jgi:predicted KAP-like P-loop ATPase